MNRGGGAQSIEYEAQAVHASAKAIGSDIGGQSKPHAPAPAPKTKKPSPLPKAGDGLA